MKAEKCTAPNMEIAAKREPEPVQALLLQTLWEDAPCGVFRVKNNEVFDLQCANHMFYEMLGYTQTQFQNECENSFLSILTPDSHTDFLRELKQACEENSGELERELCLQTRGKKNLWVLLRASLSRVKDEGFISGVVLNITGRKLTQQLYWHEAQYRKAVTSDAMFTYEVDLGKDIIISCDERLQKELGIENGGSYSDLLAAILKKAIHRDDKEHLLSVFGRKAAIATYKKGKREIICEYRRRIFNGRTIWASATMHMIQDTKSDTVRAFISIKNIDREKREEIELKRKAEHDPLSRLYNRATAQSIIDEFFQKSADGEILGVLFMVDIDNFKSINDTFGHMFGDAVLSELANRLKMVFRKEDVLARVGGDEFIVFIKAPSSQKEILTKAKEICTTLQISYSCAGEEYQISGSVGIALSPRDGSSFEALYKKADIALYRAKETGKNCYIVYEDTKGGEEHGAHIHNTIEGSFDKSFEEGAAEYIFRILYHSADVEKAILSVLELLAKHYNVGRAYIFECISEHENCSLTFEWCDKGVTAQKGYTSEMSYDKIKIYHENFNKQGLFCVDDTERSVEQVQKRARQSGARALMQSAIVIDGQLRGFLGIDDMRELRVFTRKEREVFSTMGEIIGTFIANERNKSIRENHAQSMQAVFDSLEGYLYVIDPKSYRMLLVNKRVRETMPQAKAGSLCHEVLRGQKKPCDDCPVKVVLAGGGGRCEREIYNKQLGRWYLTTASHINWLDGEIRCLLNSIDITKIKEKAD